MSRDSKGRFIQGNNSASSKRGYKDRGRQLARRFTDEDIDTVYQTIMAKVVEGDMNALSLISRYIAVAPKPRFEPVQFDYNQDDPVAGAQSIMAAIANGELAPDVGRTLIDGLSSVQRIKEVEQVEQRLVELEQLMEERL